MRIGFLITARLKSERLPNKIVRKILSREIIRWMIDRVKLAEMVDETIICTSTNPDDDILATIASEERVKCFRGSEDDVLDRLHEATVCFGLDYAINITADCPLVSFEYIDRIARKHISDPQFDLIQCLDLPHGFFAYGLRPEALKKACSIKDSSNTEVWGKYFTETDQFRIKNLTIPLKFQRPEFRLTIDYPEDLEFFNKLFNHFGREIYKTPIRTIIDYLDQHPEVVAINNNCKELYQKRWEAQSRIKVKRRGSL
jgi:spore coat polysaccharide biosynthesis protein SpsF